MGAPIAPYLANAWLNKFDRVIAAIPLEEATIKCKKCSALQEESVNDSEVSQDNIQVQVEIDQTNCRDCLNMHIFTHNGEKPLKCKKCLASSEVEYNEVTQDDMQENKIPFPCNDCLNMHAPSHPREKPFKCKKCSASLKESVKCSEVIQNNIQVEANPTTCKEYLNMHKPTHTGENPSTCKMSLASVEVELSGVTQGDIHVDKNPFLCNDCLNVHATTHTGEKPLKCKKCLASVEDKSNESFHDNMQVKENLFKCIDCLSLHTLTHTGEKPIKCKKCFTLPKDKQMEQQNSENIPKQNDMPHRTTVSKDKQNKKVTKQVVTRITRSQTKKQNLQLHTVDKQENHEVKEVKVKQNTAHHGEKPLTCKECTALRDISQRKMAKIYERYMDDVLTSINRALILAKFKEINSLHKNLTFTEEREEDGMLTFLDMLLMHHENKISSTWYTKETDTGLMLNYHSLAPEKFKKSMIIGLVHRIYRACSDWNFITESLTKAKALLKMNQYPEEYIEDIVNKTLTKIIEKEGKKEKDKEEEKESEVLFFLNYRGKTTENYSYQLKKVCENKENPGFKIPIKIVYTMRKLKTVLPSLKPNVEKVLKSDVVYQIDCPVCNDCYVGQTERHLTTRYSEHINNNGPVKTHMQKCKATLGEEDIKVLYECREKSKLMTYEALFIKQVKPKINTRKEYRSRKLYIKWIVDSLFGGGGQCSQQLINSSASQ